MIKYEQFYVDGDTTVKKAVHFLYGMEYGTKHERDNRIKNIRKMVETPRNLRRISDFAFQTFHKLQAPGEHKLSSFLDMAVTLNLFFYLILIPQLLRTSPKIRAVVTKSG